MASKKESPAGVLFELSDILEEKARKLRELAKSSKRKDMTYEDVDFSQPKAKRLAYSKSESTSSTRDRRPSTSASDSKDIMHRANMLQKALKVRHTGKAQVQSSESVLISVCKMKEVNPGKYQRRGAIPVEIEACKNDSYSVLLNRVMKKVNIETDLKNRVSFFKLNGARVVNEQLTVSGKQKEWTLGSYLQLVKKSPASLMLGVAIVTEVDSESESIESESRNSSGGESDEVSKPIHEGKLPENASIGCTSQLFPSVTYFHKSQLKLKAPVSRSREIIWVSKGKVLSDIGVYQPEEDNFSVASISFGEIPLLAPVIENAEMIGLATSSSKPLDNITIKIVGQSPSEVKVNDIRDPVVLYCVCSFHSVAKYKWEKIGEPLRLFHSTPVLYVKDEGFFTCTIEARGQVIKSHLIDVTIDPDFSEPIGASKIKDPISTTKRHNPNQGCLNVSTSNIIVISESEENKERLVEACPSQPAVEIGRALQFTASELEKATESFSETRLLGFGGFGTVYKGCIGGTLVAIKSLHEHETNTNINSHISATSQLYNEVDSLSRFRHQNIVELMGVCVDPPALVYSFMENGMLYTWLHSESKVRTLKWHERCKILKDTCRGLSWLHSAQPPVIHGDVKSQNILLDAHLNGKLGDFGFAKEMPKNLGDRSIVTAALAVRSAGYTAPELDSCQHSPKTDVYAYGVVVLECATGMKPFDKKREDPLLIDAVDENLASAELFRAVLDKSVEEEMAPYLVQLVLKTIVPCFLKHRKRISAQDIMQHWLTTNF